MKGTAGNTSENVLRCKEGVLVYTGRLEGKWEDPVAQAREERIRRLSGLAADAGKLRDDAAAGMESRDA
jgi:hypothetical protein